MKSSASTMVAALVLAAGLSVGPASAQGLLGNLLGGGNTDNDFLSVGSGSASDSSLVNAGIGSDSDSPGNIADINIGGSNGLLGGNGNVNVAVTGGNGQGGLLNNGGLLGTGLLDGDDDGGVLGSGVLGSNLTAGIDLGGLGLDLSVPGIDDLLGGGGAGPGNGNGNGVGGNGAGGRILVGSLDDSVQVSCSVNDGRQVLQLASQASLNPNTWARAANVQIVPIRLCPQARAQVAQIFRASSKIQQLQGAAARDALITASLNRTSYDVDDVFAVEASGGRLTVYVY